MKKNKEPEDTHPLDEDISPVYRCNKCHQPYTFGKCDCKKRIPRKLKKLLKNEGKYCVYKGNKIRVEWYGGMKGKYGRYNRYVIQSALNQ